jgi:hypothetical protein
MSKRIQLRIISHCIEAAARKEYDSLMDRYFTEDDTEGLLEDRIELLREFLESSDFSSLRDSDPVLAGSVPATVEIFRDSEGSVGLDILR